MINFSVDCRTVLVVGYAVSPLDIQTEPMDDGRFKHSFLNQSIITDKNLLSSYDTIVEKILLNLSDKLDYYIVDGKIILGYGFGEVGDNKFQRLSFDKVLEVRNMMDAEFGTNSSLFIVKGMEIINGL